MRKLSAFFLIMVLLGIATGTCASLYVISDTLRDKIDIISTSPEVMHLEYIDGEELGGEAREVLEGKWEEFGLRLINRSPEGADPWENVLIRVKFRGVGSEYISLGFSHDNRWENVVVYDLRTLEAGGVGGVADVGPRGGWTIKSQTDENFRLRVRFERAAENVEVEIYAITTGSEPDEYIAKVDDPASISVVTPAQDAHIRQGHPSSNYGDEEYLELATGEGANAYVLLKFDGVDIPREVDAAELYLFQYWGVGYSNLMASDVTIQVYPISENWEENTVTWEDAPAYLENRISEAAILGSGRWYTFDLTGYIRSLDGGEDLNILLKFSVDSFDNVERRIRFRSSESGRANEHPYLRVKS